MPTKLLVVGAGGHAKVVLETIQRENPSCDITLVDQAPLKKGKKLLKKYLIGSLGKWEALPEYFIVAIGDNDMRERLSIKAKQHGKMPIALLNKSADISSSALIGIGTFIAAKAIVSAEVIIEEGCIINHGSIVDHDCRIGAFSHIAPSATLGGNISIGTQCLVGANATILPSIKIGDKVTIGAGAVVTNDLPDGITVIGCPARPINNTN